MKLGIFILILFMIAFVSAVCEDGQININTASLSELDELYWIGETRAQAIIDARPFETLDDLVDAYGVGEAILEGIKNQGLACVGEDEGEEEPEEEEEIVEEVVEEPKPAEEETKETETIIITTQTIKSPEDNENKSNYALYGFVGFCFLLGVLFLLRRKKYKNEFR